MRFLCLALAVLSAAGPVAAEDRQTLGFGRLFSNDYFGDADDRWRTGSYTYSIVRGTGWAGRAPSDIGAILEYRLRSEIIAPARLNGPGSDDRAYAGALSAGVHSHYRQGPADISVGVDLVVVGPQTGLADAQDWFHDAVSAPNVADTVKANQVPNAVFPTALTEISTRIAVGEGASLRPFTEFQYGVEDIARVGVDVLIGSVLQDDLWLRDSTTGHLYSGIQTDGAGSGFVMGADAAMVGDSAYFPASFGTVAKEERYRLRAGVHGRLGGGLSYFYGITYLSEEFEGQPEGQVLGSLKLNFNF